MSNSDKQTTQSASATAQSCAQAEEDKPEHTPGPWEAWKPNDHVHIIAEGYSDNICRLMGSREWDWNELQANAQLVAAAPDLLRAAKMALDEVEYYSRETVKALADAVAKAEGEA